MSESLIGVTIAPEYKEAFNEWYAAYRDEWCKSAVEYPDRLVAADAWQAAIVALKKNKCSHDAAKEFLEGFK